MCVGGKSPSTYDSSGCIGNKNNIVLFLFTVMRPSDTGVNYEDI